MEPAKRGRVKYPRTDQPAISLGSIVGRVANLSPTGVKFQGPNNIDFPPQIAFPVVITLRFQAPISTRAFFVRRVGDLYALRFATPLKETVILTEVEGLRKKYGNVDIS